MKETVLDVLMYIFDNYINGDHEISPDEEYLKVQLLEAGFNNNQVIKAFDWLERLANQKEAGSVDNILENKSQRIYSAEEASKLNTECRGFLIYLEQAQIIDTHERELVINSVLSLDTDEIDLDQLKWVILMVLFNQPDKSAAITWMENLVLDDINASLH